MISQFYVLSPRGDTIIYRDFRNDIPKGTAEEFFRHVKSGRSTALTPPPVLSLDGVSYLNLKRNGLYFVATTLQNVSASFCLELLQQITKVFKDFCGVLNEESVRRNFILIYEIVDEVIDCGYPQLTSTEKLKLCIHNEAVLVEVPLFKNIAKGALGSVGFPQMNPKTVPSNASHRPVVAVQNDIVSQGAFAGMKAFTQGVAVGGRVAASKNEVFVDILERLTVVMNSAGVILNSSVDGCIQMKSYLSGSPELRVALNEDIVIKNELADRVTEQLSGGDFTLQRPLQSLCTTTSSLYSAPRLPGTPSAFGYSPNLQDAMATPTGAFHPTSKGSRMPAVAGSTVHLDDCNFHESVDLKDFQSQRLIAIKPPDGEFVAMNYRITQDFRVPFRIRPIVEQTGLNKLDLSIELRADIPPQHYGGNVVLSCATPKSATAVAVDYSPKAMAQTLEYIAPEKKVVWSIKRFPGGAEATIRCRITLSQPLPVEVPKSYILTYLRKEIGPINLSFEIPMYNISKLQVRYLRISDAYCGGGGSIGNVPFRWVRYVTQSGSYVCRL